VRRRTITAAWIAVAVVLVAGGVVVWQVRYRTDTAVTPIDIDVVVSLFQEQPAAAVAAGDRDASALPAVGVYSYATTGGDEVDALGGASHQYPSQSTVTVTNTGCGVRQRWVAAEERWDEFATCVDTASGGVSLTDVTTFHRFFGADERESYTCEGEPRPIGAPAGTTWVTTCTKTSGDDVQTWRGTVVGAETLTVDRQVVAVDHVVVAITDDERENAQRTETWYLAGTDLVVRRLVDNRTTNGSPIGDVHYVEHAEIMLSSLIPVR